MIGVLLLMSMLQPSTFSDDFEEGIGRWEATDDNAWRAKETPFGKVCSLYRQSEYEPPHRSPYNVLLIKDEKFGDFELTALARSTNEEYGHRDLCVFFGWQGPGQFYYVHFGQQTDEHANQVFIVNKADRTKISHRTNSGTPWDDKWHKIRVVRQGGLIHVYFDDMVNPVMEARDLTFGTGRVGLGSFDDTGEFDDVIVRRL